MSITTSIGKQFPPFQLQGVTKSDHTEFPVFSQDDIKGMWSIIFSWPLNFTFVCPTEIKAFSDAYDKFESNNTRIFGFSVDSPFSHMEWRKSLGDIRFPMISDLNRTLSSMLGILTEDGVTYRATYILDPDCTIKHISINDNSVGRNTDEILRLLQAFQAGGLRQCNWQPGQPGI